MNFNNFWTTQTNYDMIAALDNLTCTIFEDFGKNEDRSQIARKENEYLEIQLKFFRRDDKAEFCKHQQINLGESDFKQLLQLRNPTVLATGNFREKKTYNLS